MYSPLEICGSSCWTTYLERKLKKKLEKNLYAMKFYYLKDWTYSLPDTLVLSFKFDLD